MTTPFERYPDLVDQHADPALLGLVDELDTACATAPLPTDLRGAIDRAVYASINRPAHQQRNAPGRPRWPHVPAWARPQRAMAPVALVATILVAGIAYAAAPLVDQALSTSPGAGQIVQQHLGQAVNVGQSACGYTLTISRVYADANLTVIGYTLSGPAERHFLPAIGRVVEDLPSPDGLPTTVGVPMITAGGKTFVPVQFGSSGALANDGAQYLAFDTREIAQGAGALPLRLTIPAIQMFEQLGGGTPAAVACETYGRMRDSQGVTVNGQTHVVMADHGRVVTVNGPFTFDLTVPVSQDVHEYAPHQTVRQADGTTVTLVRVVVTRTDTRLYLATTVANQIYPSLTVAQTLPPGMLQDPMLSVHDGQTTYGATPIRYFRGTHIGEYLIDAPLYDYHGPWTLVVQAHATGAEQGRLEFHGTPITFRFTMP